MVRVLFGLLVATALAAPQTVKVYSEFQRVDPFGRILAADRAERPREILSPAIARNSWASFLVALEVPADQSYRVHIAQNPADALKVVVYRPVFLQRGNVWVPDALEPLELGEGGRVPEVGRQVPGQTTIVLWLDLWLAREAPVQRTRLEVQLNVADHWVIYPMEMRPLEAVAPAPAGPVTPLPPIDAPASEAAAAALRAYACGGAAQLGGEPPLSVRRLIRRNAQQDIALARRLEPSMSKAGLVTELLDAGGIPDRAAFCGGQPLASPRGGEWYLRVRDFLLRTASAPKLSELPRPAITAKPHNP